MPKDLTTNSEIKDLLDEHINNLNSNLKETLDAMNKTKKLKNNIIGLK